MKNRGDREKNIYFFCHSTNKNFIDIIYRIFIPAFESDRYLQIRLFLLFFCYSVSIYFILIKRLFFIRDLVEIKHVWNQKWNVKVKNNNEQKMKGQLKK